MFDELDDPTPAAAPAGAAATVAARGKRLRRKRYAAWGAGGTSLVLVLVAVATGLRHEPPARVTTLDPVETPSYTAPPDETPAPPTGSPSPSPTETPTPRPTATREPTPTPTSSPTDDGRFPDDRPDGKPGWSTGLSWCYQPTTLPPAGGAPRDDLTFTIDLPDTAAVESGPVKGTATIHNGGSTTFAFYWHGEDADASDGHGHTTGHHGDDAIFMRPAEVKPGEDYAIEFSLPTTSCGDTSDDADQPLPAGSYAVAFEIHWEESAPKSPQTVPPSPSPSPSGSPTPTPVYASGDWVVRTSIRLT